MTIKCCFFCGFGGYPSPWNQSPRRCPWAWDQRHFGTQRAGGPKKGRRRQNCCDFLGFCFIQAGDQNRFFGLRGQNFVGKEICGFCEPKSQSSNWRIPFAPQLFTSIFSTKSYLTFGDVSPSFLSFELRQDVRMAWLKCATEGILCVPANANGVSLVKRGSIFPESNFYCRKSSSSP